MAECIGTFFFVGRSPKAPGTVGSLAALPFAWFLWTLPRWQSWSICGALFLLGVWAASRIIERSGVQDHQSIVVDEVIGIFLVTSIAPHSLAWYALAFSLFRIFDIWKPWPVRWVDRKWKGGSGAMMDDVVAAMIAAAVLAAILLGTGITMEITPAA
jgi:phosphatidylglycerophosphatase A